MTTDYTKTLADLSDKEIADAIRDLGVKATFGVGTKADDTRQEGTQVTTCGKLPLNAFAHVVEYGWQQIINDSTTSCGDGTLDEKFAAKEGLAQAKADALHAGDITKRIAGRGAVDDVTKLARQLARKALKALYVKEGKDYADFTGLTQANKDATLDKFVELEPQFRKDAEAEIAKRKETLESVSLEDLLAS